MGTKTETKTPTERHASALSTMAYHAAMIMCPTELPGTPGAKLTMACAPNMPVTVVQCTSASPDWALRDYGRSDVWASMTVDGRNEGNRCGARDAYVAKAAPYIAAILTN